MTKRSLKHKHTERSEKDNAGCVWGFISLLDFRQARNQQKLLSDGRHARPAAASKNARNKSNLLNKYEENCEDMKFASTKGVRDGDKSTTSVKMLIKEEMSKVNQHKQISCAPKRKNSECGDKIHIGCSREDHDNLSTCEMHSSDLTVSTSLAHPDQSQLQNLVQVFSNNLNLGALLQEFHDNKYKNQNSAGCRSTNLFQNQFVLQKELNEILESFYNSDATFDGALYKSEEFKKAFEFLSSHKNKFLEVLQDPNSFQVKHVGDHQSSCKEKRHASESCKLLEAGPAHIGSLKHQEESASHKMFQKQILRNIFRKKHKSEGEKQSEVNQNSQPPKTIVLLKPGPMRHQSLMNVSSVSSSIRSQHLRANNERTIVGFSFREIKRRLKHAIGESKRDHHLVSTDGGLHRIPSGFVVTSRSSCSSEEPCQSVNGGKRSEKIVLPKEYPTRSELDLHPLDIDRNTRSHSLRESIFQREAKKHLIEMLDHEADSKILPPRRVPRSLEKMLSLPDHDPSSPVFSPGRYKEPGFSPRNLRFSPIRSRHEHIMTDQCGTFVDNSEISPNITSNSNDELLGKGLIKDQINDVNSIAEALSPSYSPGRHKEPSLSPEKMTFSPQFITNQQIDSRQCSLWTSESGSPLCTSSNSDHRALDSNLDLSNSQVNECSSTREVLSPKGVVKVMDVEDTDLMVDRSSDDFDRNGSADMTEECEHDEPLLWSRLDSPEEKPEPVRHSVPLDALHVQHMEAPEIIIEKAERPSPNSVLESFLDDVISPENTRIEHFEPAKLPVSPREVQFEEYDDFEEINISNNQRTCMDDEEFKYEYIISLLGASGLSSSATWEGSQFSHQLLDASLYDEVETPTGEIPDDLKLLFDCISEILESIYERYSRCNPWVSIKLSIVLFPSRESIVQEVLRGTNGQFCPSKPRTLHQIIKQDMDNSAWMGMHIELDAIGAYVGDEIFQDILEEMAYDLWGSHLLSAP